MGDAKVGELVAGQGLLSLRILFRRFSVWGSVFLFLLDDFVTFVGCFSCWFLSYDSHGCFCSLGCFWFIALLPVMRTN